MALLAELRPIIDQRPTYGYRRVTALLNRKRRVESKPAVNSKRVLRVMNSTGSPFKSIRLCGPLEPIMVSSFPAIQHPLVLRSS